MVAWPERLHYSNVVKAILSNPMIYRSHSWQNWTWLIIALPTLIENRHEEANLWKKIVFRSCGFTMIQEYVYSSQTMPAVIYIIACLHRNVCCMHLFAVCIHVYHTYSKPARYLEVEDALVLALGRPNAFCVATSGETGAWSYVCTWRRRCMMR